MKRLEGRRPRRKQIGIAATAVCLTLMLGISGGAVAASKHQAAYPANTSAPVVTGTAVEGQVLTTTNGVWTTTAGVTFTYQWRRCDAGGGNCPTTIPGATSNTYTLTSADVGHSLRSVVIATYSGGSGTAISAPTTTISALRTPVNTTAPAISGVPAVGHTLTTSNGSWTGTQPIAFSYQWRRCNTTGSNCPTNISGASGQTYTPTTADVGHSLRAVVIAKNIGGQASVLSPPTNVIIIANAPVNTTLPVVTGTTTEGHTLTTSPGAWTSTTAVTITYQWRRCDTTGGNCPINIPGATAQTYELTQADVGHTLRAVVIARNTIGSSSVLSAPTTIVAAPGPPGVINLGNGVKSVPASSVALPARLVIDNLNFQPTRIQGRAPFVARFHVSDTRGYAVRGVLVYALGLPYSWVQKGIEVKTDTTGWATMTITPSRKLPIGRGHALVMFVRARVPGQPILAGSSARRLVQITTAGKR